MADQPNFNNPVTPAGGEEEAVQEVPQMKAMLVVQNGDTNVLAVGRHPKPTLQSREVMVKVLYTACNRADVMQKRGSYPPPAGASPITGLELVGEVTQAAEDCQQKWRKKQRVMALVPGGAYAQYCAVDEGCLMRLPEDMEPEKAAGIPETFLTAYQLLFWVAKAKAGDTVLIHAAASGVGLSAIQLCLQKGLIPICPTRSQEKMQWCAKAGASNVILSADGKFAEQTKLFTQGKGASVVLDCVGGSYWKENMEAIAMEGTMVVYGLMGTANLGTGDLAPILRKRVHVTGSTLRARPVEYKRELVKEFSEFALPLFDQGVLKPYIHVVMPLKDAEEAQTLMEKNQNAGKVILDASSIGRVGSPRK